jgi:hypothetical protein
MMRRTMNPSFVFRDEVEIFRVEIEEDFEYQLVKSRCVVSLMREEMRDVKALFVAI